MRQDGAWNMDWLPVAARYIGPGLCRKDGIHLISLQPLSKHRQAKTIEQVALPSEVSEAARMISLYHSEACQQLKPVEPARAAVVSTGHTFKQRAEFMETAESSRGMPQAAPNMSNGHFN